MTAKIRKKLGFCPIKGLEKEEGLVAKEES